VRAVVPEEETDAVVEILEAEERSDALVERIFVEDHVSRRALGRIVGQRDPGYNFHDAASR
jgi:hypothetical protein